MENTFHYLIMTAHLQFYKSLFYNIKDTGLTLGQPKVLEYLFYHDGAVQKQIAVACCIEPATITSVLAGMENKGLIIRKKLNGNRRNLYVYLTDKGRELAGRICLEFETIEKDAFERLNPEEIETVIRLLSKIKHNMDERNIKNE